MDKESYKIQLKFNKIGSAKYENQILLDKRELLKNLKRQISSFLTIHEDCFLIKRGSQHGHELKDLNVALNAAHLNNGSIVHIELGKPSNPGEIQIILSVAEVWNESDSESFKFWSLGDVKVLKDANISEIKNKICEYALSLYPSLTLSPATIRLRERNINHLLRVLTDHDLLSDFNHGLDKVHLSLQIDIDPENFDNSKLIILTRKFSPST